MKTVCKSGSCTGCMACIDKCAKNAINIIDNVEMYNAVINETKCVNCNACMRVCPQNNDIKFNSSIYWIQGWAKNIEIQKKSASGGFATAIANQFIKNGGVVFGCKLVKGEFRIVQFTQVDELNDMRGSKYVKSNPRGVYKLVDEQLNLGTKVLFIGLPCQVAAINQYIGDDFKELLYTIDLVCHGTPSPKILDIFLDQHCLKAINMKNIQFRYKNNKDFELKLKCVTKKNERDRYSIAFLRGLMFTENCYSCKYSKRERISDITLGDSWGNCLEDPRVEYGVSLALCQTSKGKKLIESSEIELMDVDIDRAIASNAQLNNPTKMPQKREIFIKKIKKEKNFDRVLCEIMPYESFIERMKGIMRRLKFVRIKKGHLNYGVCYEEIEE